MQINLDFSTKIVIKDDSKKVPVGVRIGEKFKQDLEEVVRARNLSDLSELLSLYIIDGYSQDYKNILLAQQHGHKTVAELLRR